MGIPGVTFSGFITYGTALITGASQAATVAAATEKPRNFKKSRRPVEDSPNFSSAKKLSIELDCGNSDSFESRKDFVSFNSSIPFQYFFVFAILLILTIENFQLIMTLGAFPTTKLFHCNFTIIIVAIQ